MPRRKKEHGRPPKPYPPRIDAPPEEIARRVLSAKRPGRFGAKPKREIYRCVDCGQQVNYPDTLYQDGRCEECHAVHSRLDFGTYVYNPQSKHLNAGAYL